MLVKEFKNIINELDDEDEIFFKIFTWIPKQGKVKK